MKRASTILLVLCSLVPNAHGMEKEEIWTYVGVLLLSLAVLTGGVGKLASESVEKLHLQRSISILFGFLR